MMARKETSAETRTRKRMNRMPEGRQHVALVTGANRGIGLEVCRQLASNGFVVLLSARDAVKARAAAGELAKAGTVEPLSMDVANPESVQTAAAEVSQRYSHLDVLVNN